MFLESFTHVSFESALGYRFTLKQANISVSSQGTVRGIHFADVPPGQAKYVQCHAGRILDIVVDIRIGSPTFGQWDAVELSSDTRQALFIGEGLGHAFCALTESATVGYLCSEAYAPEREHGIHPFDADLGLPWPQDLDLQLSTKDSGAPTFLEARDSELLPKWQDCVDFSARLRS